ncbi:MAG: RHS repeat-associated core domain-containing protein [Terriglobales bacterium]
MITPRLCVAIALLVFGSFAFAQAPVCDVTCAPDPGGSGYDNTVDAMTKVQNMRGTQTIYAPETAGSKVTYHATGNGKNAAQGKIVAGSSSYSYAIPILSLPGRNGLDLNLILHYNSAIWNANSDTGTMTFNADRDFPSYGFRLGYGFIESNAAHSAFTLVESDGTKRKLTGGANSTYASTDSSFIQFVSTTNILTYKNGTRVFYQQFPNNQTTLYRPTKIEDTNGNLISISYRTDSWIQGEEIDTITDTLGRQVVFSYDANTHELTGIAQGSQQYVTFSWNNNYLFQYNFSGWLVQNSPANNATLKVLTGVTYTGNGAGYLFTYGGWGIINTIQFGPSGGSVVRSSVSYNYPPGTTAQGGGPWFGQQTVFDGVNTYNWQYSMPSGSSAITDPYGTQTKTNLDPSTGLRKSIIVSSGSTTLRTITNTWNSGSNPTLASTTTTLGDTGQQSQTTFSYDTYKNVTEIKEYDYGLIYKRRTHIDYLADTNYLSAHILDRPTNVYVYDESGTETLKRRTDVGYDENPPTAPNGQPPSTVWDSSITNYRGNVTTIKRYETPSGPSGKIERHFLYDVAGNLIQADLDCCTSKTWTYNSATVFAYPTQVVSGTTPQLTVNMTYYSDSGLLHTYSDENSQQSTYSYDPMFRLTNVQRADLVNYGTSYNDTQALHVITNTSPVDSAITVTTLTQLDGAGRVNKQTVEDSNLAVVSIVDTAYDALGRRTAVSSPYVTGSPVYTQISYDALGRTIKIVPPDGTSNSNNTQYSYYGNTVTVTDPAGKQRMTYSDAFGRLVRVDEPGGTTATGSVTITGSERYVCDPNGPPPPQCTQIWDIGTVSVTVGGFAATAHYGHFSTPASIASDLASAFNSSGSPVTASVSGSTITFTSVLSGLDQNYAFSVTAQTFDPADFLNSSFNGSPASGSMTGGSDNSGSPSLVHPFATFYSYDAIDNLIQANQGIQQRTYVYGGLGHVLSAQTPESGLVTYSYQNGGAACTTDQQNVCQRTDARNVTATYQYDSLNRLKTVSYSDGTPSATYNYDAGGAGAYALGRLTSMTDGTGSETYTYDRFGRIINVAKVVGSATYNIGYGYNYVGQVKTLTYPDGIVVNQSYDAVGRLSQMSSGGTNYLTVPSTSYNAASLPEALTYGSGVQATIGYNARFQLASLDYAKGSTDLLNLTYNYTQTVNGNPVNNGQIQGVTDTRGNSYSTSYTYDALGRLSQGQTLNLTAANTWKLGWVYDRYGNRSQQNLLGGTISTTAPQLTIDPTTNRITTAGYSYDAAGNLQADGTSNAYTYDAENRLATLNTGTTTATYSYDGKGRRVKKVVGANTTVYIFSGSKVIAEYANGVLSVKYVYAGSQLLASLYNSSITPVFYHYPDHLSARLETNPNGVVTRTFGHLPFGETWYETGISVKQKFTSYERDTESGLDYAMFRYDSSRLGRFMTADLLAGSVAHPPSLDRYPYVGDDPVNFVDPLGLGVCPFITPDQVDSCGGGAGGDGGGGGAYVDGVWTMGPFVSPSLGGPIPMWGFVWVPSSSSGVYIKDDTFTISMTTGYWQLTFLGFSGGGSPSWLTRAWTYIKSHPVTLSVNEIFAGQITFQYSTGTICGNFGLGASFPPTKAVTVGILNEGDMGKWQDVLSGPGYSFGANLILGYQGMFNSSGKVGGPTVSGIGLSGSYTKGSCTTIP